jgi:hypothetical protein
MSSWCWRKSDTSTILDLATLKALYAERKVTPRDAMQAVIDRSAAGRDATAHGVRSARRRRAFQGALLMSVYR